MYRMTTSTDHINASQKCINKIPKFQTLSTIFTYLKNKEKTINSTIFLEKINNACMQILKIGGLLQGILSRHVSRLILMVTHIGQKYIGNTAITFVIFNICNILCSLNKLSYIFKTIEVFFHFKNGFCLPF
jgi:hypothetical protein